MTTKNLPMGLTLWPFVGMLSAVVVIIGAFLPWAKVMGFISVSGIDGDGTITFGAAAISCILIFLKKTPFWITLLLGVVVLATSGYDYYNMMQATSGMPAGVEGEVNPFAELAAMSVGIGLYLTMLGGLGMLAAPIISLVKKK